MGWIIVHLFLSLLVQTDTYEILRLPEKQDVISVPLMKFLPPYVSNIGVRETRTITLRCKVRSDFTPSFLWEKISNSKLLPNTTIIDSYEERFYIKSKVWSGNRYMSRMIITKTKSHDSGLYRCSVVSLIGTKLMRDFKVNIQGSIQTSIRITSFTQMGQGVLEIFNENKWMRINERGFTWIEANLACRNLGYQNGGEPRLKPESNPAFFVRYGAKRYREKKCILAMNCTLDATDFKQCFHHNVKIEPCYYKKEVGVVCRVNKTEDPEIPLRLWVPTLNVYNLPEGIVEIFHDGRWGFIADDNIEKSEIDAICGTLGYTNGGASYNDLDTTRLYDWTRPILVGFNCNSKVNSTSQCHSGGWTKQCTFCRQCSYCHPRLNVRCWKETDVSGLGVRLAASNVQHSGRVEVLHNGTWGTIRTRWLQQPGANVICKMLGYRYGGLPVFDNIPPSSDPVLIDYIECPLNASVLEECKFDWQSGDRYRVSRYPIGVQCRTEPMKVSTNIRLIGHNTDRGIGRLEYFIDGYWASVCGAYMGTSEASLFCHMLGYSFGGHIKKVKDSYLRGDFGPVLLKYIECPWGSTSLKECPTRLWTYDGNRLSCDMHELDVQLECRSEPFPDLEVKLLGGKSDREGDLLIKHIDSMWYHVCGMFSPKNVAVVCRQLGFRYGGEMNYRSSHDDDNRSAEGLRMECNGKEQNIGQCNVLEKQSYGCGWGGLKVYVKCYKSSDAELQMTVSLKDDGEVIINRLNKSWNICADTWDDFNAHAVCRMLNRSDATATFVGNDTMPKRGRHFEHVAQQIYCPRGAKHLGYCFYGRHISGSSEYGEFWNPGDCQTDRYGIKRAGVLCK